MTQMLISFVNLLNELVQENKINFIIVTHHRLTMAKMNRLLGVTMQEKGISKILSVDLEKQLKYEKPVKLKMNKKLFINEKKDELKKNIDIALAKTKNIND